MKYTIVLQLSGALAEAVAVEWTELDVPGPDGSGWEPCVRLTDGRWRFASREGSTRLPHLRAPGVFGNIAIRYRLEAGGPWSEASADRKEITIVAEDGEGEDGGDNESPLPVLPVLIGGLLLTGSGKIGSPVAAAPGAWTGATNFAFQWCRDGVDIPGATGAAYVPVAEDDLSELACRVTATGAGGSVATTSAALLVTHVAPVAKGELFEEVFDQGSGVQQVAAAGDFTGEALVFSVEGAGATIDAGTGVVGILTDAPLSGEIVTVTATNSGGAAASGFPVTVEAAETVVLAALGPDDWRVVEIVEDPVHKGMATAVIETAATGPAAAAIALYWTDTPIPQEIGHPTWDLGIVDGRRRFRLRSAWDDGNRWHVRSPGEFKENIAIRYQIEGAVVGESQLPAGVIPMTADYQAEYCSPWSTDRKSFRVAGDFLRPRPRPTTWNPFPRQQLDDASERPLSQYSLSGNYLNAAWFGQAALVLALNSHAGSTLSDNRLLSQLRRVITGDRQPSCQGGYWLQHDCRILSAIAVARHVPRVWNTLSEHERIALSALVKAGLVAGAFMSSDNNPFVLSASTQRPLRGADFNPGGTNRNWNPNYRLANPAAICIAIAHFGFDWVKRYMATYDHDELVDELASARLSNTHAVFSHAGNSTSPSKTQIERAVRQFRRHDQTIDGYQQIALLDTRHCFSRRVAAGLDAGKGIWDSRKSMYRGRIMSGGAGLPNEGALGMCLEFDSNDAGGARSSFIYCLDGARLATELWVTLAVAGLIDRAAPEMIEVRDRMDIGYTDLNYKWTRGYYSYSKGGSGGGNDDWTIASRGDQHGRGYSMGIWFDVFRPWFFG